MNKDNLNLLIHVISESNESDLEEILIYINARKDTLIKSKLNQIRTGDKVHFRTKSGKTIFGKVSRCMRKNVLVQECDPSTNSEKMRWRVHPSFVKSGWPGYENQVKIK